LKLPTSTLINSSREAQREIDLFEAIDLSLGLSATVDKSTRGKLLRDQSLFGASQLLLIRVLVGSFKEINLSLGLSATADKSTRGKREIDLLEASHEYYYQQ
jgi:hypothetical protein